MLGRRGPAQAAFTNPEVRELGEMTQADIVIDPVRDGAGRGEPGLGRLRGLRPDQPPERRDLHRVLPARARGQEAADRPALPAAPRSRSRATARSSGSWSARNELAGDGDRIKASDTGERETIECGPGAPLDRLQRRAARGRPLRRRPRPDPERRRPGRRGRRARPRPLRDRLDQARPLRRDRHQQEGRRRDRQHHPRGPRGGLDPRAGARRGPGVDRGPARRARARPRHLRGLEGDRRRRGRRRRAPRPPAREVRLDRRDGRGLEVQTAA